MSKRYWPPLIAQRHSLHERILPAVLWGRLRYRRRPGGHWKHGRWLRTKKPRCLAGCGREAEVIAIPPQLGLSWTSGWRLLCTECRQVGGVR